MLAMSFLYLVKDQKTWKRWWPQMTWGSIKTIMGNLIRARGLS